MVLAIQYGERKTTAARFAFTGAGVAWLFSLLLPWAPAFAAEQRFSRAPQSGSAIKISLNPVAGGFRQPSGIDVPDSIRNPVGKIYIPLRIGNLPAGSMLLIDRAHARFAAGANSVEAAANNGHIPVDANDGVHLAPITVPAGWLAKHGREAVHVELEYSLTLLASESRYSIPAEGGEIRSPDLGWCQSRINDEDTFVQVHCMRPGKQPDAVSFVLENASTGLRNPEFVNYMANYSPSLLAYIPDSMRRAGANLPFRDASGVARYPIDASQLKNARVDIRTCAARDHFTRKLAIDGVRLNDWRGLDSHGL